MKSKDDLVQSEAKMESAIQYLTYPESNARLVVITEEHYLSLLDRSDTVRKASEAEVIPDDVIARIRDGENPVLVLRTWRQLTGRQLARMLGVSPSMVSQMERQTKCGSTKTVLRLADVLGIPIELLFKVGCGVPFEIDRGNYCGLHHD